MEDKHQTEHDDILFQIHLLSPGENRHRVIILVREKLQITPEQARSLVDSERPLLFADYRSQVEAFARKLRSVGAMIEISYKPH